MSSIQYEITLDLKRDYHQVLVMKEGDVDSREIIVTITDNGQLFDITGRLLKYKWHKPDHHIVENDCEHYSNTAIKILCTEQMLLVNGIGKLEVLLYDTDNKTTLSSMSTDISIKASVVSDRDIESTDEFGTLNDMILNNKEHMETLTELEETVSANEEIRIANENTRIDNENNRIGAEVNRETNTANAINNANTATQEANTAKDNAIDATNAALLATDSANEATQKANDTIDTMERLMKDDNLVHKDDLGVPEGVATLDEKGNIPASQLPSFVDDVLDGTYDSDNDQFLDLDSNICTPESGKIYIDINTRTTYRWSGTTYVSIGSSLALGTTSSTAYAGDKGLALEERVTDIEEYHNNIPAKDIKFNNTDTTILGANVQDAIVELTAEATHTKAGLLSAEDKKLIDNYADIQVIDITLYASNWTGSTSPYSQIVTVEGISTYNNCSVEMPTTATADELYVMTGADVSYDESIGFTFTVEEKPTIDITVQLCVGTSMNVVEVPEYIGESPVLGVKGSNETDYRNGYVNITKSNVGLGNCDNTSDADKPISKATQVALNAKQNNLGFTPVQQGGGANQGTNKVYLGWGTDGSGLRVQVDITDLGALAFKGDLGNYLPKTGGTMNGSIEMSNHNIGDVNNIWLNPYADYLTNILNGKLSTSASCNKNWNWSDKGGQPTWLWGGEDGWNMYVYNPANFNVRSSKYLFSGLSGAGYSCMLTNAGNFRPDSSWDASGNATNADGTIGLGVASGYRWKQLCAASSTIVTSDKNRKDNITPLTDKHLEFFMLLMPVSFTFKDGTSGRTHIGFISQDVEEAMAKCGFIDLDFAGFCKDKRVKNYLVKDEETGEDKEVNEDVLDEDGNPEYIYSLRYEEFIALIAYALQRTILRVDEQDKRMNDIETRISELENKEV